MPDFETLGSKLGEMATSREAARTMQEALLQVRVMMMMMMMMTMIPFMVCVDHDDQSVQHRACIRRSPKPQTLNPKPLRRMSTRRGLSLKPASSRLNPKP